MEVAADPVTGKASTRRWIVPVVTALVVLYLVSPYYAFWRFTVALRAADTEALRSEVDFTSVRESLKRELYAKLASLRPKNPKRERMFEALQEALGPQVIDSLLDAYVTPEGLASFLANPKLAPETHAAPPIAPAPPPGPAPDPGLPQPETRATITGGLPKLDWSRVHYAFFSSPREFLVDFDQTKLRFRFTGLRWQLKEVEVPIPDLRF